MKTIGNYYLQNEKIYSFNNCDITKEIKKSSVYEVIKIIDSVPIFIEDHINRLIKSLKKFDIELIQSISNINKQLEILMDANNIVDNINLKIICNIKDNSYDIILFFIERMSPQEIQYEQGIHVITYKGYRSNPNIKSIGTSFKDKVKMTREKHQAFEALLIDPKGYITEGTRSNIFFIKKSKIYTPPARDVLLGVTRKHILELSKKLNISIIEKPISITELGDFESIFLSGTSIDILKVYSINKYKYSLSNSIMNTLIKEFCDEIKSYINDWKNL